MLTSDKIKTVQRRSGKSKYTWITDGRDCLPANVACSLGYKLFLRKRILGFCKLFGNSWQVLVLF